MIGVLRMAVICVMFSGPGVYHQPSVPQEPESKNIDSHESEEPPLEVRRAKDLMHIPIGCIQSVKIEKWGKCQDQRDGTIRCTESVLDMKIVCIQPGPGGPGGKTNIPLIRPGPNK